MPATQMEEDAKKALGSNFKPAAQPIQSNPKTSGPVGFDKVNLYMSAFQQGASPELAAERVKQFDSNVKMGATTDQAVKAATSTAAVLSAGTAPTMWDHARQAIAKIPVNYGKTLGDVGDEIAKVYRGVTAHTGNFLGATDEEYADIQKRQNAAIDKMFKSSPSDSWYKRVGVGAAKEVPSVVESFLSPSQMALMVGTFGESALAQAASKLGIPAAPQTARVISKLVQAHFAASMVEGTASSIEQGVRAVSNGDWETAGRMGIQGLADVVMAKRLISHEEAETRVRGDLEETARKKYGQPEGSTLSGVFKSKFDSLNPYQQAEVIHDTVQSSPEYRDVLKTIEDGDEKVRKDDKLKKQERKLAGYRERAVQQTFHPDAVERAMTEVVAAREAQSIREENNRVRSGMEASRQHYLKQIIAMMRQAAEETEQARREQYGLKRQSRPARKQQEARNKAATVADRELIAGARETAKAERERYETAAAEEAGRTEPQRNVDVRVDENGHTAFGATYFGEDSTFGVAGNASESGVYRQTPRGIEYLDANGFYSESPEDIYLAPDHATAETVAKISSLRHSAEDLAEKPEASAKDKKEAEVLADIERRLVTGEINGDQARKEAGIAEKTELPTEFDAARAGQLNGPLHERTPEEFREDIRKQAEESGWPEAEIEAIADQAPTLVRSATESNLHHVSRSGDYIVSGKGVTWTLDSKGMLHPSDGGAPVPLMKSGRYSNQAMQLAQSGRVGYGGMSREQRRAETAKNRSIQLQMATVKGELLDALAHVDRVAAQQQGLELVPENAPRADEADKQRRRNAIERPGSEVPSATRQVNAIAKQVAEAVPNAWNKLESVAAFEGVHPDEVFRQVLALEDSPRGRIAGLEPGDRITDPFRKDPWVVEKSGDGLVLRSMGGARMVLDRIRPELQILELAKRGEVVSDRPAPSIGIVKFDPPSVITRNERVEAVKKEAEKPSEPPKTPEAAKAKAAEAEKRTQAAEAAAVEDVVESQNPRPTATPEEADKAVDKAEESIKTAETAYAQQAKAEAQTVPEGAFPQRAPVSVGLVGNKITLRQNQQEFPAHYEAVPMQSLQISHRWEGGRQVPNEEYPADLQPRTISDDESKQNEMRARPRAIYPDADVAYSFAEYADKTINGKMGPSIVDSGGRVIGGNTRLGIMLKHLELLKGIQDPEMREIAYDSFQAQMQQLGREVGINIPNDGKQYVVVRMMEQPITTTRQAVELGNLFNKDVGVKINRDVQAVAYGKMLTEDVLTDIAHHIEQADGLRPAMQADPGWFADIARKYFKITAEEEQDWYEKDKLGTQTLHDAGKELFEKALLGTVIQNTKLLDKIKNTAPHRALGRAIGNLLKLRALPDRNIIGKVNEAVAALAETMDADPQNSLKNDKWYATYQKDQVELAGLETKQPEMHDRIVEAIWRALNEKTSAKSATPTYFNRALEKFIGDQSLAAGNLFGGGENLQRPVDFFNTAFGPELEAIRKFRGDATKGISETEFQQALNNRELSDQEREDALREEEGKKPKEDEQPKPVQNLEKPVIDRPALDALVAKTDAAWKAAQQEMAKAKQSKGYITPDELKRYLEFDPATKGNAEEHFRVAKLMAEYVYDADPPEGVDRKDALAWVLERRVAGIGRKSGSQAGAFVYPKGEEASARGFILMLDAAHEGTFIHEFAHAIFPMLSDEDIRAINSIKVDVRLWQKTHPKSAWDYPEWDGNRESLAGKVFEGVSEKFSYGLEKALRDENPTGFSAEVGKVLEKVKQMFISAYRKFAEDPLSPLKLTEKARQVFADMLHITDYDAQDNFRKETEKARAAEKKKGFAKPTEEPHPLQRTAKDLGASGIRKAISGEVLESIGDRVDPSKPTAVLIFPDVDSAAVAWLDTEKLPPNAELVEGTDGTYGIRFNTKDKVPNDVLYQEAGKRDAGVDLAEKEALLKTTVNPMLRKLLEIRIENLKNEIRAKYGVEPLAKKSDPEVAKAALKEIKDARVSDIRRVPDESSRVGLPQRTGGISKPALVGLPRHAGSAGAGERSGGPVAGTATLRDVRPVALEPQPERAAPVGLLLGDKPDPKAWIEANRKGGTPTNLPMPTEVIQESTARVLKYGGQKPTIQTLKSALAQGDGVVMANDTGTGKTYILMGLVKEFLADSPDAKILYITKNGNLVDDAATVGKDHFGLKIERKTPDAAPDAKFYGTSYRGIQNNDIYKNTEWDLVIADESGEARNWYKKPKPAKAGEKPKIHQGQSLMDVIRNSKKAVYSSATPFHSPMEYGYLEKLNLWPKGQFEEWIKGNFAYEKVGDQIIAKLDPGKQAKLREQLIERGQFTSQQVSYEGVTTHLGIVPMTAELNRSLNRIHEGISRAKAKLLSQGKKGLSERLSAFEARYTKAFLERARLPEAIQLAKRARAAGYQVLIFSETTSEDLFRRPLIDEEGNQLEEAGTYRKLDEEMGGELSRIMPAFPNVYDDLKAAFGDDIGDHSGNGGTDAQRQSAKDSFMDGSKGLLYTTYPAGGVGGSFHDTVGDRPRLGLYLGPPYSGVLLKQSLGRLWRFGVKSNVHMVFMASDSEPDIRLLNTKVAPRLKALSASVRGQRDSLGDAMTGYTDEEKQRERQDMLAYEQGNEAKVNAQSFQVRSKRNVNIDNWSAINFPNAREAMNKGMQIEMSGADKDGWATLYQAKSKFYKPPTLGEAAAAKRINAIAQAISENTNIPEPEIGLGAAKAAEVVEAAPEGIDKTAAAEGAMRAIFRGEEYLQDPETQGWEGPHNALKDMHEGLQTSAPAQVEMFNDPRNLKEKIKRQVDEVAKFSGDIMFSTEQNILAAARKVGAEKVGREIVSMARAYFQGKDGYLGKWRMTLLDEFKKIGFDPHNEERMRLVWDVQEGNRTSDDSQINEAAQALSKLMVELHRVAAEKGVSLILNTGDKVFYRDFLSDPNHMPHFIDWNAELTDPETGETKSLREVMGKTFYEARRLRMMKAKAKELGKTEAEAQLWIQDLKRRDPRSPVFGNARKERSINVPFIRKDFGAIDNYLNQMAGAVSLEEHMGSDLEKLQKQIARLPNEQLRSDALSAFKTMFEPQDWSTFVGKQIRNAQAFEAYSKMTLSPIKVPFHLIHSVLGLSKAGGGTAVARAIGKWMEDPSAFKREKYYMGVVNMRANPWLLEGVDHGAAAKFFRASGFDALYGWVRGISGESARVWMEQDALASLKRGGTEAEEARRLLKDTMLVGDHAIDQAIESGKWDQNSIETAQRSFANVTTFSDNPLQMPGFSRMSMARGLSSPDKTLHAAVRATYALQSFTIKTYSFLREHLYDEVVHHGNLKPLATFLILYPIAGQLMFGATAGTKGIIHRGWEKARGKQHTHDSWDTFMQQKKDLEDHPVLGAFKLYLDGVTLGAAMDRTKRVTDYLMLRGEGRKKEADAMSTYMIDDELEQDFGPIIADMIRTIATGVKAEKDLHGKDVGEHEKENVMKLLEEMFPIARQLPDVEDNAKKKRSGGINLY